MPAPKTIEFVMPNLHADQTENYWDMVNAIEHGERERPGFRAMIEWGIAEQEKRGVAYSHLAHLRNSYKKHTGIEVDINA